MKELSTKDTHITTKLNWKTIYKSN